MDCDLKDAFVLAVAAHVHAFLHKELELAVQLYDRALELNENSAFAWGMSGITYGYLGEGEKALERFRRAWRLSPFDPFSYFFLVGAGMAEFVSGRFDEAVVWLRKTLRVNPRFLPGHRHLVTALANAGRLAEARDAAKELLALEPGFSVRTLASWYPLRPAENLERYVAGLRGAGLPE
jgi:tetratricopeptide (TPR) repeat protein